MRMTATERDQYLIHNVWLLIPEEDNPDGEASHEANIVADGHGYSVDWYHVDVGLVHHEWFPDLADAQAWLTKAGYADFTCP